MLRYRHFVATQGIGSQPQLVVLSMLATLIKSLNRVRYAKFSAAHLILKPEDVMVPLSR